jgi:Arginyl-tRNA synthetase
MSKRAGTFVSLDELIDEVGTDAARFHLLLFGNDHTMRFDIEAVKRRSMDNPVYYVQYGHARIASILRTARDAGVTLCRSMRWTSRSWSSPPRSSCSRRSRTCRR